MQLELFLQYKKLQPGPFGLEYTLQRNADTVWATRRSEKHEVLFQYDGVRGYDHWSLLGLKWVKSEFLEYDFLTRPHLLVAKWKAFIDHCLSIFNLGKSIHFVSHPPNFQHPSTYSGGQPQPVISNRFFGILRQLRHVSMLGGKGACLNTTKCIETRTLNDETW